MEPQSDEPAVLLSSVCADPDSLDRSVTRGKVKYCIFVANSLYHDEKPP